MALLASVSTLAFAASAQAQQADNAAPPAPVRVAASSIDTVDVTSSRVDLMGAADTASQGSVTQEELDLRPVYRVGQLLETLPGLVVTVHSGEGKANQYLLRGFNLDHGTDIANFIDDMPINRPTNTHGQGYSDLNFVMPQLLQGVDYTKGPYYAEVGDFGAVGSEHMKLANEIPDQVSTSIGTLGDEDLFVGGTTHFEGGGKLVEALDVSHLNGPYTYPDGFRKISSTLHYSQGTETDGYSVTGMYFKDKGRNSTDVPLRAISDGLIGRYGTLDPTDGNRAERWSLSGHYGTSGDDWTLVTNLYTIHSTMALWNDFTHLLHDPINGDQEQQDETRTTVGGGTAYTRAMTVAGIDSETTVGLQERYDSEYIDRRHTRARTVLDYCNDGLGVYSAGNSACQADNAQMSDSAPYVSNTTHWLSWLRTTIGLREDYYNATDQNIITRNNYSGQEWLLQPKGSVAFGPWYKTEFYISSGQGFHSDDIRGSLGALAPQGPGLADFRAPLMAKAKGYEIGIRNSSIPDLQVQLALFREDFSSEVAYNADAGQDQPTAPSRRQGMELSAEYHPMPWLEFNTDLASTTARYFKNQATLANSYGIVGGDHIANAPKFIGSFGILVDNLGPWFGGLQERILGPYPLTDGPADPHGGGYAETNVDVGYKVTDNFKVQLAVFNLLNRKAWAAEYYYATNITPQEVAKYGNTGVSDYQVHPLEPLSARLTLTATF